MDLCQHSLTAALLLSSLRKRKGQYTHRKRKTLLGCPVLTSTYPQPLPESQRP